MRNGGDHGRRLSSGERLELRRRVAAGEAFAIAAAAVGCSTKSVQRLLARTGGLRDRVRERSPLRLSVAEREEISRGLRAAEPCRAIARRLLRSASTVSREVERSGGPERYRAFEADEAAIRRARRPKPSKLARCARLRAEVEWRLSERWSPQQIAARLVRDHPEDPQMRVSHETIYRSLFVQGRGALRAELTRCLRSGRAQRRPQRRHGGGELKDMVLLADRPAEVTDRAVPGHWEGDLILGKGGRSAIGTLVERQTRFTLLLQLGDDHTAAAVRAVLAERIGTLPEQLRRTLTWDRGKEMAEHVRFSVDTGVEVYFCDPRSPWQRATNENTNGLLRQYFPKGTDLSAHNQKQLDTVARELNGRPRQILDWMKPSEAFARVIAMTA